MLQHDLHSWSVHRATPKHANTLKPVRSSTGQMLNTSAHAVDSDECVARAQAFYSEVWSRGRVTLLDRIMAEDHKQMDMVNMVPVVWCMCTAYSMADCNEHSIHSCILLPYTIAIVQVWQAERTASGGRRSMKRGILAYRAAYPDIKCVMHPMDARIHTRHVVARLCSNSDCKLDFRAHTSECTSFMLLQGPLAVCWYVVVHLAPDCGDVV